MGEICRRAKGLIFQGRPSDLQHENEYDTKLLKSLISLKKF